MCKYFMNQPISYQVTRHTQITFEFSALTTYGNMSKFRYSSTQEETINIHENEVNVNNLQIII